MRILLILLLTSTPALAHPGHILDVAGQGHVVAGILIGIAVLGGLLAGLADQKGEDAQHEEEDAPA